MILSITPIGDTQVGRWGSKLLAKACSQKKSSSVNTVIVEEIHRQEEIVRCTKAVSQAKQGQWVNWEGLEKKKIKWRDLLSMEASRIRFTIGAMYDVLPSPQNLNQWFGEDTCTLCSCVYSLRYILSGCKVRLSQGRYTWCHKTASKDCRQINLYVREKARPLRGRHS